MSKPTTGRLAITAWRNDDYFEYPLRIVGLDVRALVLKMEIRRAGDTGGPPRVRLDGVLPDETAKQGLRVAGVSIVDGVEVSDVRIRMDRGTLQDLGYQGVRGDAATFEYALLIGGRTRLTGPFILPPHAFGSDAAPLTRPESYSLDQALGLPNGGATLTISADGGATVIIDGADLVSAVEQQVAADAEQAAADREAIEEIASSSYRAVPTYGDREAIPLDKRQNGLRVQVMEGTPRVFEWRTDLYAPGAWTGLLTQAELQKRELQTGKQNQDTINGLPDALTGLDQASQNILAGVKRNATLAISTFAALAASTAGPVDLSWAIGGVTPRVQALSWGGWSIDLDGYARALTLGPWTDRPITILSDSVGDGVTAAGTWGLKAAAVAGQPLTTVALYSAGSKQVYRSGAKPLRLTLDGNRLPAGGTAVTVTAINGAAPGGGNPASPLYTYAGDTRALTIAGTIGGRHATMSATGGGAAYTLTADAGSTATGVPAGSLFVPDFAQRMGRDELWIMVSHNHFYSGVAADHINPVALADVDALVRQARGQRICIMGLLADASWVPGTPQYDAVRAYNAELKRRYPAYYVQDAQGRDPLARMIASGNGGADDNADAANGIVPRSLRGDSLHPNDAGNAVLAALMVEYRARQVQPPAITLGTTFTLSADGDDGVGGSTQATAIAVPSVSQLGQVVRVKGGASVAGQPISRRLNGLGFVVSRTYADGEAGAGGRTRGLTDRTGHRVANPLGFVQYAWSRTRGFLLPGGVRWRVSAKGGMSVTSRFGEELLGYDAHTGFRYPGSGPTTTARYRRKNPLGFVSQREALDGGIRLGKIFSPTTDKITATLTALTSGGTIGTTTTARYRRKNPLGFATYVETLDGGTKTGQSRLIATLQRQIAAIGTGFGLRVSPSSATVATHTDGRTLSGYRAALARLKAGAAVTPRVMIQGDSWTEKRPIPQALANALYAAHGAAGAGWISVFANLTSAGDDTGPIDGATFTRANWTTYDASANGSPNAAVGCSHEGHAMYSTGATATATYTFTGTAFRLFYGQWAGTLQYRVDGGAWVNVASDGSGALGIVSVTGLAAGAHTVELTTAANGSGGMVAVYGLHFYTEGASGAALLKCGNSGITATQFQTVAGRIAPITTVLAPDVIIFILGTNDYRLGGANTPTTYTTFLSTYVAEIRAALPAVGFIFVAPARSNVANPTFTLAQYRDALAAWCIAGGHEFYNHHDEWADWATENARSQWLDNLHVNATGALRVARRIFRTFLDL